MDHHPGSTAFSAQALALPGHARSRAGVANLVARGAGLHARRAAGRRFLHWRSARTGTDSLMRERALHAIAECQHLAGMTEEPGRITRRFLTAPVHHVHAHLRRRMIALGMDVRVDAAGNLRGLWTPPDGAPRRLVFGSHIDTVPD